MYLFDMSPGERRAEALARDQLSEVACMDHADDLLHLFAEESFSAAARAAAAEKLIKMWEEGRQGKITLHHLAYVGDHADEPQKSKANQIIRDNL